MWLSRGWVWLSKGCGSVGDECDTVWIIRGWMRLVRKVWLRRGEGFR
jgi:hypothetical protein